MSVSEIWWRPGWAWGAEKQSSPATLWEKATSTHSKECYPNLKACIDRQSCPFYQWHTCILRSFLLGVFSSSWVVSVGSKFSCCVLVPHGFFFLFFFSNIISSVVCSTLVIKQKLPGIYVQPSYKSALSKNCEVHICCFYLLLIDSLLNVQSSSINTTHVSVLCLKLNSISFWTLYLSLCMLLRHVINDLVSKNVNYFFLFSVVWSNIH